MPRAGGAVAARRGIRAIPARLRAPHGRALRATGFRTGEVRRAPGRSTRIEHRGVRLLRGSDGVAPFRLAAAALLLALQTPAGAVGPSIDIFPSFVGLGAGVTTEWLGAKETLAGVAPAARKQLPRHRFIEVYGALVDANVLDSPNWE